VIGHFSFQKFNFDTKIHFPHFSIIFFVREERGRKGYQIPIEKETVIIDEDFYHQND
jgi:hypothetical protein